MSFPTNPADNQFYFEDVNKVWIYNNSFKTWYKYQKRGLSIGTDGTSVPKRSGELTSGFIDLNKPAGPGNYIHVVATIDFGNGNFTFGNGRGIYTLIPYKRDNTQIPSAVVRWWKPMTNAFEVGLINQGFAHNMYLFIPPGNINDVCTKMRIVASYNLNNTLPVNIKYAILS